MNILDGIRRVTRRQWYALAVLGVLGALVLAGIALRLPEITLAGIFLSVCLSVLVSHRNRHRLNQKAALLEHLRSDVGIHLRKIADESLLVRGQLKHLRADIARGQSRAAEEFSLVRDRIEKIQLEIAREQLRASEESVLVKQEFGQVRSELDNHKLTASAEFSLLRRHVQEVSGTVLRCYRDDVARHKNAFANLSSQVAADRSRLDESLSDYLQQIRVAMGELRDNLESSVRVNFNWLDTRIEAKSDSVLGTVDTLRLSNEASAQAGMARIENVLSEVSNSEIRREQATRAWHEELSALHTQLAGIEERIGVASNSVLGTLDSLRLSHETSSQTVLARIDNVLSEVSSSESRREKAARAWHEEVSALHTQLAGVDTRIELASVSLLGAVETLGNSHEASAQVGLARFDSVLEAISAGGGHREQMTAALQEDVSTLRKRLADIDMRIGGVSESILDALGELRAGQGESVAAGLDRAGFVDRFTGLETQLVEFKEESGAWHKDMGELFSDDARMRKISKSVLQWLKTETVQEVESILRLTAIFEADPHAPLMGGWAMDAASMFEFVEMILQTKPSLVVELGSGSSSIWIARALQMNGSGRLVSFDHLEKYADATRAALVRQGLDSLVEVRLAELRDVDLGETKHSWYDPSCFKDLQGIDLLLVDGPPGAVGPLARFPAFPVLKDRLADRSLIVVDDAIRPDEIKMMNRWMGNDSELAKLCDVGSRAKALVFHRPERKAGKRDNRA